MDARAPDEPSSLPTVSVVIPVRNESEHIDRCIEAVLGQTYERMVEVVVVDGASADDTRVRVGRWVARDSRVRLIDNPKHSTADGLNAGIENTSGEIISYVLGHSVVPPDYVARLVVDIGEHDAWCAGGRYLRVGHTPTQRAVARVTSSPFGVGDSAHNYRTTSGWVETVFPGTWPRWVFDRVGRFDPDMLVNEDNELSHRIRKAGGGIWFDPTVAVEYVPRATLGGLFRQYHGYARGKLRVWRKHRGGLRWRHAVPAALVAFAVGGGASSVLVPPLALPWLAGLAAYGAFVAVATLHIAKPDAPAAFVAGAIGTIHAAYGLGFWLGVVDLLASPTQREETPPAADISRPTKGADRIE